MKKLVIVILSAFYATLSAQSIYDELNHQNFRKSPEFNKEINPSSFSAELLNASIFFATNEIRAKKRLSILEYSSLLEKASTIHSTDMAEGNFFGHVNKQNKKHREPEDRAKVAGISNPKIAENVIEGFLIKYKSGVDVIPGTKGQFLDPKSRNPLPYHTYLSLTDQLIDTWMKSKGHRSNILSEKAVELGCGATQFYMSNFNDMPAVKVTQNFQWFYKVENE